MAFQNVTNISLTTVYFYKSLIEAHFRAALKSETESLVAP